MPGINAALTTFTPNTTIRSSDANANFSALNSAAVSLVVATGQNTNITTTVGVTIINYSVPVTGLYRVNASFRRGQGTVVGLILQLQYTDGFVGSSRVANMIAVVDGGPLIMLDGGTAHAGIIHTCMPSVLYALSGHTLQLIYQDPGGTPSDQVFACIERLT